LSFRVDKLPEGKRGRRKEGEQKGARTRGRQQKNLEKSTIEKTGITRLPTAQSRDIQKGKGKRESEFGG